MLRISPIRPAFQERERSWVRNESSEAVRSLQNRGGLLHGLVGVLGKVGSFLTAPVGQAVATPGVGALVNEFDCQKALLVHAAEQGLVVMNTWPVHELGDGPVGQEAGMLVGVVKVSEVKRLVELDLA
jgi:hypothetical protein